MNFWHEKKMALLHLPFGGTIQVRVHSADPTGAFHVRLVDMGGHIPRTYAGVLNSQNDMFCNGRLLGRVVFV